MTSLYSSYTPRYSNNPQRCKNVWTCEQCLCKKILSGVRSLQKFCCFVEKNNNVAILRFLVAFFLHSLELYVPFIFFELFGPFTLFCRKLDFLNHARVKLFWVKPCSCKKVVFLHLWQPILVIAPACNSHLFANPQLYIAPTFEPIIQMRHHKNQVNTKTSPIDHLVAIYF